MQRPAPTPLNIRSWIRKLDLMTLRLFRSIQEERNYGRAAVREAIAPSAVTKRINDLEDTLGFRLFQRDARGTTPTHAGEVVGRHVGEMLAVLDRLHHELSELAEGVRGHVRICASESALVEFLASDLASFHRAFPTVTMDIEEAVGEGVLRSITAAQADLGVCVKPAPLPPGLDARPYRKDQLVAIMSSSHPLAVLPQVSFEELLSVDLIGWSEASFVMRTLHRAADELRRPLRPRHRVTSADAARSLVRSGHGVAIQPSGLVWPFEDPERIRSVPLSDPWARREIALFVRSGVAQPVAIRALLDHLSHSQLENTTKEKNV
jgi:DNA-binding transcriptional LysR family regulator